VETPPPIFIEGVQTLMPNNKTTESQHYKTVAKTYQWIILGWFILSAIATFIIFTGGSIIALTQHVEPKEPIAETLGTLLIIMAYFTFYCVGIYGTYNYYQRINS